MGYSEYRNFCHEWGDSTLVKIVAESPLSKYGIDGKPNIILSFDNLLHFV